MAKRTRGKPDTIWNALKDTRVSADVTWIARSLLKSKVRAIGLKSLADFLENLARGRLEIRWRSQKTTIAQLMIDELDKRKWEVERLTEELDLELERIDRLLNFEPAEMHELIALQTILSKPDGTDYDLEDLIEINQRKKTNGERQSVECDY